MNTPLSAIVLSIVLAGGGALLTPGGFGALAPGPTPASHLIDAGGPYTGLVGRSVTFAVTTSDPNITFFRWDLDGDSVFDVPGPSGWTTSQTVVYTYSQPFSGRAIVEAWDGVTSPPPNDLDSASVTIRQPTPDVWVSPNGNCRGLNGTSPCVTTIGGGVFLVDPAGTVHVLGDMPIDPANTTFLGIYVENVDIDKPLTLRGEDTIILRGLESNIPAIDIRKGSDQVTVERMMISRSTSAFDVTGVFVGPSTSNIVLTDLRISVVRVGIHVSGASFVTISDNEVRDNDDFGVVIDASQEVTLVDSTIAGNNNTGLEVSFSRNLTVRNNIIQDNYRNPPVPVVARPSPIPLQGGGGGGRFLQTDPTAVEYNVITENNGFGLEITGDNSFGISLLGNNITDNLGHGLWLTNGAYDLEIAGGTIAGNDLNGIAMEYVHNVTVRDADISDNQVWGVYGEYSQNVHLLDSVIARNGPFSPVVAGTKGSVPSPLPLQGPNGGGRFLQTDPSEIRGNTFDRNIGPGISLEGTIDFTVADNVILAFNADEYLVVRDATNTTVQGNEFINVGISGTGIGTAIVNSQYTDIRGNTYVRLDTGILIDGGCHVRIGPNTFIEVTHPYEFRSPCDVQLEGLATMRFTPRTLNLKSEGRFVTLRFEVSGIDVSQFDLASVSFTINGVLLAPPPGSPSQLKIEGGVARAMVKLDRAEVIAALGASGTYEVAGTGEIMPGVLWVGSDTIDAILP